MNARDNAIERLAECLFDREALGARWENESDDARAEFRADARRLLDGLHLVAISPELVERVREAERRFRRTGPPPIHVVDGKMDMVRFNADALAKTDTHAAEVCAVKLALADAVLSQLGGGR